MSFILTYPLYYIGSWLLLLQHSQFFTYFYEGGDALVEVFALVAGGELNTDAGLALRHNGVVEAGDVDAFFLHLGGEDLRKFGVVEHHGADGALRWLDVEAGCPHLVAEVVDVLHEAVVQFVAFLEHLEDFEGSADDAGSQ